MDEATKIKIQNDGIGNVLKEIKERLMRTLQLNHQSTKLYYTLNIKLEKLSCSISPSINKQKHRSHGTCLGGFKEKQTSFSIL